MKLFSLVLVALCALCVARDAVNEEEKVGVAVKEETETAPEELPEEPAIGVPEKESQLRGRCPPGRCRQWVQCVNGRWQGFRCSGFPARYCRLCGPP